MNCLTSSFSSRRRLGIVHLRGLFRVFWWELLEAIHRITEWLGLEEISGGPLVQTSLLKQGHLETVAQNCNYVFWVSPKMETSTSLSNMCQGSVTITAKESVALLFHRGRGIEPQEESHRPTRPEHRSPHNMAIVWFYRCQPAVSPYCLHRDLAQPKN